MEKIRYPQIGIGDILGTFWNAVRFYRGTLATLVISIVVVNIVEVISPLYYKQFFDTVIAAGDRGAVGGALFQTILIILAFNGVVWLGYRVASFVDNRFLAAVSALLRQQAFDYLLGHSYSFFSNNFTGSLVQRVNRLARSFDRLTDKVVWNMIPLFVKIVGVGIVLYLFKPMVAAVMLGWALLFLVFNYTVSLWKLKYDIRVAETDSRTTGVLADAITNHHSIQLFTKTRSESGYFKRVTNEQATAHKTSLDISAVVEAGQALLIILIEFFVFYLAIGYWTENIVTVGFFVLLQAYILGLTHRLWEFSRVVRDIYESYADAKEMAEIMKLPHEIRDRKGAGKLAVPNGIVEFEDVSFSFNQTRGVLEQFNLRIEQGEKIALVGPSGAGKSTIVKLLLRLHEPAEGVIAIDGMNIKTVTLDSLRKSIALVPQDTLLFHRTLMENIRYGSETASDEEVKVAARLAHCDDFVDNLPAGFETYVGERGIKLSGGERQRVAIARAILKNAPILILDEATSSLDSHSEMLIQDALDTLMKGKTVIVIAHRLSTIRKMDRIVVINEGKIVETGDHETLLTNENGLYKKLWTLQAGGFIKDTDEEGSAESEDEA
ncbi:MAG: ABC transporter ATP-binding protein [Patescibacteria group bacterium]